MNNTIKLVIDYQKNQDNDIFEKLVEQLKEILRFKFYKIPLKDHDDLYQEMLIGLYKLINKFKVYDIYKLNKEIFTNDLYLKYIEYGVDFIKEECEINYLDGFIDKYDDDLFIDSFKNDLSKELFIYEYNLFCNENQFKKILILKCQSIYIDYLRRKKLNISDELIADNTIFEIPSTDINKLTKKDQDFLNLFLKDNKILTEQQVANILGVTQQAVNKRKKSIYKKLNK